MLLGDDVVNGFRLAHHTGTQTQLTQAFVTLEHTFTDNIPFRTITALVSGLSGFCIASSLRFCGFRSSLTGLWWYYGNLEHGRLSGFEEALYYLDYL